MAYSFIKKQTFTTHSSTLKTALLGTLACIALSSCDNNKSGITHINTAFENNWEEIARSQGKLKNEMSHLAPAKPEIVDDSRIMAQAPTPVVTAETIDIIPKPVPTAPVAPLIQQAQITSPPRPAPHSSLNPKNMFGRDLNSNEARLDRLERAVQDMRNDFSRVEPSVNRLMFLENDIQTLITELQKINSDVPPTTQQRTPQSRHNRSIVADDIVRGNIQQAQAIKPASAPWTTSTPTLSNNGFVKKSAPALSGQPTIYDIRVGEHPGKTRIVMDVNSKASFNVDIDNSEKIMIVDLPNTIWSPRMAQNFAKSPHIKSFRVEPSGNGHLVIFQLKKSSRIAYKGDLKGFEGSSRRLVIDLSGS